MIRGDIIVRKGCNVNWNNFELNVPQSFSGTCYLYVEDVKDSIEEDIEKISKIKEIKDLDEIIISSNSFQVAKYFNRLLKDFNIRKKFDLLKDFEIKDRSEIDFSKLDYDEVTVPFDYIMYGIQTNGITNYTMKNYRRENIITVDNNRQQVYPNIYEKINTIIDEIFGKLSMYELDDIDKSVLVSNWIQKNIQFIDGKISLVGGKKYICNEYDKRYDLEDVMTVIDEHIGICNGIAKLSLTLLTHPKVGCKCNMAHSPGHAYITQIINDNIYVVDNTWCITRNPNHMDESLKASSFSDIFLLIGEDKLNEDEDTLKHHTMDDIFKGTVSNNSIPRDIINQSVEKLKAMGVSFEYNEQPKYIQHIENNILSNNIHI